VLQRVYAVRVAARQIEKALRNAFWLYRALAFNAEFAQAGAWIARATRLTAGRTDCSEQGYLLLPAAERELRDGDYQGAFATAEKAAALGARCGDRDVVTVAVHLQGRARVGEGRISEGLALLDEAMLAISAGETSSRVTAWIYCKTIQTCQQVYDVRQGPGVVVRCPIRDGSTVSDSECGEGVVVVVEVAAGVGDVGASGQA